MSGTLFVVATPIGNLEDVTLRALRILREVDVVACEDTRRTRALLSHFDIHTPTVSYFEHNKLARGPQLVRQLLDGRSIALVTDAGTPGISDPGFLLVRDARAAGVARTISSNCFVSSRATMISRSPNTSPMASSVARIRWGDS